MKDLKTVNPAIKKSSKAHVILVETTLKKNVSAMPKTRKVSVQARVLLKSPAKTMIKALFKEIVISGIVKASASSRIIRLL